jgi:hypothetical protein
MIDASFLENPNLAMLEIAVQALGDLCESLVFVDGCATGLSGDYWVLPVAPCR